MRDKLKKMAGTIKDILTDRVSILIGAGSGLIFLILYHISIDYLNLTQSSSFSFNLLNNPVALAFRQRAPYLWEAVAILNISRIQIFISPLNIILAIILGVLIMFNFASAVYSYRFKRSCNLKIRQNLPAIIPAFLTGFACCAPAFLIALSPILPAFFSVYLIQLQPFLIPVSFILMIGGITRNIYKLSFF